MNKANLAARGGLLTAVSVVLLYMSCMLPMARLGICAAAGVVLAIPLLQQHVKLAICVYLASSVIGILFVPLKLVALSYCGMFGLYTICKYGIEKWKNTVWQWVCKLIFAVLDLTAVLFIAKQGFFGQIPLLTKWGILPLLFGGCILFCAYDIAFSKLIEGLRRIFPAE